MQPNFVFSSGKVNPFLSGISQFSLKLSCTSSFAVVFGSFYISATLQFFRQRLR